MTSIISNQKSSLIEIIGLIIAAISLAVTLSPKTPDPQPPPPIQEPAKPQEPRDVATPPEPSPEHGLKWGTRVPLPKGDKLVPNHRGYEAAPQRKRHNARSRRSRERVFDD